MALFSSDDDAARARELIDELRSATENLRHAESALETAKREAIDALHAERQRLEEARGELERTREQAIQSVAEARTKLEAAERQSIETLRHTSRDAVHRVETRAAESIEAGGRVLDERRAAAEEAIGQVRAHALGTLEETAGSIVHQLQDRGEQLAHTFQTAAQHATEHAVAALSEARDQIAHGLENASREIHRNLDEHGGSWIERVLHSANSVLGKVPVVGVVSEAVEGIVHELNKKD
ncbi:MAG: hypothetical protein KIT84_22395 [Labilithrix sp.]|nr:hypothetical protein [Labilithrix sp.]MCW5813795.1 hypothetical protein [Labilithrix sp.]